jgi:predicted PurR-regulated permease PerM
MPLPTEPPNRADNNSATDAVLASAATNVDTALPLLRADDAEPTAWPSTTVDVRSTALVLIATLGSLYVLHWAGDVFVPLLMGLMLSYALTPVVNRMVRWHLPRTLAAAVVLIGIVTGVGSVLYQLSDDAVAMIESMPEAAQKLRRVLEGQRSQGTAAAISKVQKAAAEIERATETDAAPAASRGVTKVQIERGRFNVKDYVWPSAMGLASASARVVAVVFIAFFLLASGDTFRRKMVRIAGPTFGQKKLTLQALDEIDHHIQRYLGVQVTTSVLVGVATWLTFLWIGVERAALWGVASFVLNFIPYFGSIATTGGAALMGLVQFGTIEMALLVGGVSLAIQSLEGYILTPWMTSRASRMNSVAVFVGVLAWGWLWGVAGLFLGVPIMMTIKAVCDRVDDLKAVGELLGE